MRYHRYSSLVTMGKIVLSSCFILLLNVLLISVWLDWFVDSSTIMSLGDLFGITIGILFGNIIGMVIANASPDIAVGDDGLAVRFYFKWLFVPWKSIISINRSFVSVKRSYLVRVRRLTIIHRLVSFSQSGSIQPGFLISPNIGDSANLLRTIREHVGET